ncbi:aminotransferase class IV [Deinococcus pimensis]|uniref:aminotransferase class IV n=1 Tax=Deinococcus pimensis TaxID=309888 RepID=UPI0004821DE6|nr:aminotransferase class IV [Deinococcus pimensis]
MTRLPHDLNDPAWLHGLTAFTTVRVRGGEPLLWDEHVERLAGTCAFLGLPDPRKEARRVRDLIGAHDEGRARLTVTLGGLHLTEGPLTRLSRSVLQGVSVLVTDVRVHPQLAVHKTGNYLPYVLAGRHAHERGAFEGLLLGEGGAVVDGSRTSLLLDIGGELVVPTGGLPGVTRAALLRLWGRAWSERPVSAQDLARADHVWIAGSGVGVLPVREVLTDGQALSFEVRNVPALHPAFVPPPNV